MSRRDEVVETLDNAFRDFRRDLSAALAPPPPGSANSNRTTSTLNRRVSSALQGILDLPPPEASTSQQRGNSAPEATPTGPDGAQEWPRFVYTPRDGQAHPTLASVPFGSSVHRVFPLPATPPNADSNAPPSNADTHAELTEGGMPTHSETLPVYSRRAPGTSTPQSANLPPLRLHCHISRSKKLELQIKARGEDHVVLTQTEVGGDVWIESKLVVTLPSPEAITYIKIRVKGVVRTMVMKVHGSGRHPIGDEVVLCEDSDDLWTPEMSLLNNESADPTKLQGTFTFTYRLKIPGRIRSAQGADPAAPRRSRATPPSFVLSGNASEGAGKGVEWASCRYYVKVTMGRKGLLKVNERFIVPLVYVPRHAEPEMSAMRTVALAEGRPTPGPAEDVQGWNGQKIRHIVKKGMFGGKRAWYDAVLLLPTPATFARLSTVPFAIKLTSSDPSTTTRFPLSSITAYLVQRTQIAAQGLSNAHDSVVAQGTLQEDGPSEGTSVERDREGEVDPAVWEKRFTGTLALTKAVGSSFRAPNLAVQFLVAIYISVPGAGNDAEVVLPVEIVSCSPVIYNARAPVAAPPPAPSGPIPIPGPSTTAAGAGAGEGGVAAAALSPDEMGLPPSYFQVLEEGERNR